MAWGESAWGALAWGEDYVAPRLDSILRYVPQKRPLNPRQEASLAWDFPLRFTDSGDIVQTSMENSIRNNLVNSVMIVLNSLPLKVEYGSRVPSYAFENISDVSREIGMQASRAAALLEPRAVLDNNPVVYTSEDGSVTLLFTYLILASDTWTTLKIPVSDRSG